jgi:hypothetical protein
MLGPRFWAAALGGLATALVITGVVDEHWWMVGGASVIAWFALERILRRD